MKRAVDNSRQSWTVDLLIVLAGSAALRIALFSGFVGGDDFAYAILANEILDHGYPVVGPNVFAARPVLMLPIAAAIAMLGWTEWAMVLPVFVGSLIGIASTYVLGRIALGRMAGLCAAATLALLPLDLVYATTTTNDILGSSVLAAAALLAFRALARDSDHRASLLALASGFVAGLAMGVKLSMVLGVLALSLVIAITIVKRRLWGAAVWMGAGFAVAQALLLAFFWQTSGDMLVNYKVELGFSHMFMAEGYLKMRVDALWSYPGWAFGFRPAVPDLDPFFPYGLLFPYAVLSTLALLWWRVRILWPAVLWFWVVVLLVQFWPLQVFPAYIPIHRLPRFMHLAAVPGSLLIAGAVVTAARGRWPMRVGAGALWLLYLTFGWNSSVAAAQRHHDSMQDLRFGAAISSRFPATVVTDSEMRGYLMFRRGFDNVDAFHKLLGAQVVVPSHSLVIAGGGRRIDMDPGWADTRMPAKIPDDWVKLADLPGDLRPWRRSKGAVFLSGAAAKITGKGFRAAIGPATCGDGPWQLVDVIDVGETNSERQHLYRIEEPLFAGERMLFSPDDGELEDDGRSFRRSQSFDATALTPNQAACIVKRVDPGARRQVSRLTIAEATVATIQADHENPVKWLDVGVVIPAAAITQSQLRFTEQFVSAAIDVNCYRIEIYQRGGG